MISYQFLLFIATAMNDIKYINTDGAINVVIIIQSKKLVNVKYTGYLRVYQNLKIMKKLSKILNLEK